MGSDLLAYLGALAHHWKAYLTGSIVAAAIGWSALDGFHWSTQVILWALLAGIPVAGFFAWRADHHARIALEAGPNFVVSWDTFFIEDSPGGADQAALILPLTVTNRGALGAALEWRVMAVLRSGKQLPFTPILVDEYSTAGFVRAVIQRQEFIQERTAKALARGQTEYGYFVGLSSEPGARAQMAPGVVIRVECADYSGRRFVKEIGHKRGEGLEPTLTATPTLSNVFTIPNRPIDGPGPSGQAAPQSSKHGP